MSPSTRGPRATDSGPTEIARDGQSGKTGGIKQLRGAIRAMHRTIADLSAQIETVQVQLAQLATLRAEDADAASRMDRLAGPLDKSRVTAHIRQAVARADISVDPVPHLIAYPFFPTDTYAALLDAIPSRVFIGRGTGGLQQVPLPPVLAPVYVVATWLFVASVMSEALGPALADRFGLLLRGSVGREQPPELLPIRFALASKPGRLVLRRSGYSGTPVQRPGEGVTAIITLARASDRTEFGSVLHPPPDGSPDTDVAPPAVASTAIQGLGNSALVFLDRAALHTYASIPAHAREDIERCTCEFYFRQS